MICSLPVDTIRSAQVMNNLDKDTELTALRNSVPGIKGLHGGERLKSGVVGQVSREVDSGSLDDVSGCGEHGNTRVLQLGGTEPSQSGLRSQVSESKGVESLEWKGASSHVIKSHGEGAGRGLQRSAE